jgi:hypothetical protein
MIETQELFDWAIDQARKMTRKVKHMKTLAP